MKIGVVIPAAGQGRRMAAALNKPYLRIHERPVLAYTIDVFEAMEAVDEIVVVVGEDEFDICRETVLIPGGYQKVVLTAGGTTRQQSVYAGLKALSDDTDMVLIHDGARPLIDQKTVLKSIEATRDYHATIMAVPAKNTIKYSEDGIMVDDTPDRSKLFEVQTPQSFDYQLILKAHQRARVDGIEGTDDAFLAERLGIPVKLVMGTYHNIKITTPEDLAIAEALLKIREADV